MTILKNMPLPLTLLLMATPLAVDLPIDHVTLAGRDLSQLRAALSHAGLPTEYGGKHSNGLTEMALAAFPDGSYLEFITPQPGADASKHYWGRFMQDNAGPCAWAITSPDISAAAQRLTARGIAIHRQKSGRKRPDGFELKWETATVGPEPQGSYFPFLIHDETPRDQRVFPHGKPASGPISGVARVVVAVRDLDAAIAKYRAAFDLPAPQKQTDATLGARMAWFPNTPVILASPASPASPLATRIDRFGEAPCAFVLAATPGASLHTSGSFTWFSQKLAWLDRDLMLALM